MPQSPSPSSLEQVRQALRRAFDLGQLYWQQADSESYKQNAKADATRAKVDALVEETCAALSAVEALGQQAEPALGYATRLAEAIWRKHYREDAPNWKPLDTLAGVLTQIDNMTSGLARAPAALQQQEAGSGSDEQIEAALRLPVADGEDVAFYLLYGCQGVSPEVEAIMVREVARTILAACAPSPTEPADSVKVEGGSDA